MTCSAESRGAEPALGRKLSSETDEKETNLPSLPSRSGTGGQLVADERGHLRRGEHRALKTHGETHALKNNKAFSMALQETNFPLQLLCKRLESQAAITCTANYQCWSARLYGSRLCV